MLYFFPAEWTVNGVGTEANEVLSAVDKQFVAGAKMYPKSAPTVADATELKVDATRRTAAAIGKFGEETCSHSLSLGLASTSSTLEVRPTS